MNHPDAIAALTRLGRLGLDYRDRLPLVVPDRRIRRIPLWAPPPPVKVPWQQAVTQDATSGVFIPQSSSEWTTFNAANGWANPDHLYLFQEASGSILDKIGSSNLTVAGSPAYQQTVASWSTKALKFTEATNNQRATSTSITNINTTSALCIFYANTPTTPAANRKFFSFGTTSNVASFTMLTTNAYRVDSSGNNTTDTVTTENSASVKCFALLVDRTNNLVKGYCTSMAAIKQPGFASGMTGNEICWGSADNGTVATIGMNLMYAAVWVGSNAEKSDQDIKSLMMQLGNNFWNPSWTVAYTANLAETDSTSESLAVAVSVPIAFSESASTAESLAAVASDVVALSETDATTEAQTIVASDVVGLSESASTAESQTAVATDVVGFSDSATTDEQITAGGTNELVLAETLATADLLTITASDIVGVTESASTAELIATLYTAILALVEEVDTLDSILVGVPYNLALTEHPTIAEAIALTTGIPARELIGSLVSKAWAGTMSPAERLIGALVSQAWSCMMKPS